MGGEAKKQRWRRRDDRKIGKGNIRIKKNKRGRGREENRKKKEEKERR